jgi:hypothetical protein
MSTTPTTKTVGTLTAAELEQLRKDAALAQQYKASGIDLNKMQEENAALRRNLEEQAVRDRKKAIEELRADLLKYAEAESLRMNNDKFSGAIIVETVNKIAKKAVEEIPDAEIDKLLADKVDGKEKAQLRAKENAHKLLIDKANEIQVYEANFKRANMVNSGQINTDYAINALSKERRDLGLTIGEQAYWSDEKRQKSNHDVKTQIEMAILSAAFKMPMLKPGTNQSWLAEHAQIFRPDPMMPSVLDLQRRYITGGGMSENDFMAPRGKFYQMFMQEDFRNRFGKMFVAEDTMTPASVIGTGISNLAIDFSSLVVMATWPTLLAKRIAAKTGPMPQGRKRLFEIAIPRSGTDPFSFVKHWLGAVDSDTPNTFDTSKTLADGTVVSDAGSLASATNGVPAHLWAYLGEVVQATTTITVTVTLPNLVSSTATVTFLTTDTVGTIKQFTEAGLLGDKYIDATAVASTGWADAAGNGEVGFFFAQPWRGHTAGAGADTVGFTIDKDDVTETIYDKEARLTLALMEDLQNAVSEGSIDGPVLVLNLLRQALESAIDGRLLYRFIGNVYTLNQRTFLATTPGAGYSPQSWKALLKFYQSDAADYVHRSSGQDPNIAIWNKYDKTSYYQWLTWNQGDLSPVSRDANDPFADSKAAFQLDGRDIYISEHMQTEYIGLCGNQLYGVHSYDYIPLKVLQGANADKAFEQVIMVHHRGYHDVPNTARLQGGRSIGFLKVARR